MVAEAVNVALLVALMVAVFERLPLVVVELVMWTLPPIAGARLPNEQLRIWAPTPPEIAQVPGPVYAGLMDQFTPAPAGRGSLSATLLALPLPPTVLLDTAMVKPTVEPTLTDVESAVFERLKFGDAMVSGKATTTSLN